MRAFWTVLGAAILIVLVYLFLAGVASYFGGHWAPDDAVPNSWAPPSTWSNWRDVVIVFTGLFWLLAGLLLVVLLVVLVFLAFTVRHLLRENVAPAVDSLKDSLDNLRGTTEFAGETVVSPIIRVYSVVSGVRSGVSAIGHLPDRIRGRKKGKK
ncbi:MAG: hypothetical protein IT304_08160 [Dehalococcoidia bacterium]|nr:hypothetical protein [Dehalococcoidia bacterium]